MLGQLIVFGTFVFVFLMTPMYQLLFPTTEAPSVEGSSSVGFVDPEGCYTYEEHGLNDIDTSNDERVQNILSEHTGENYKNVGCAHVDDDSSIAEDLFQENTKKSGRIDVNTATIEELRTIPGVGEGHATRIVQYVEANGPLTTPREIQKIPWIGDGTYNSVKDYLEVTDVAENKEEEHTETTEPVESEDSLEDEGYYSEK